MSRLSPGSSYVCGCARHLTGVAFSFPAPMNPNLPHCPNFHRDAMWQSQYPADYACPRNSPVQPSMKLGRRPRTSAMASGAVCWALVLQQGDRSAHIDERARRGKARQRPLHSDVMCPRRKGHVEIRCVCRERAYSACATRLPMSLPAADDNVDDELKGERDVIRRTVTCRTLLVWATILHGVHD